MVGGWVRLTAEMAEPVVSPAEAPRRQLAARIWAETEQLLAASLAMARRFQAGGRLFVAGAGAAASDAQHVAVEFLHPVIVGKPALPALSLADETAAVREVAGVALFAHQVRLLAGAGDMLLAIGTDGDEPSLASALAAGRALGLLTIGLFGQCSQPAPCDHLLLAGTGDPRLAKEARVTSYHLLWETVHVLLDHLPARPATPDPPQ